MSQFHPPCLPSYPSASVIFHSPCLCSTLPASHSSLISPITLTCRLSCSSLPISPAYKPLQHSHPCQIVLLHLFSIWLISCCGPCLSPTCSPRTCPPYLPSGPDHVHCLSVSGICLFSWLRLLRLASAPLQLALRQHFCTIVCLFWL